MSKQRGRKPNASTATKKKPTRNRAANKALSTQQPDSASYRRRYLTDNNGTRVSYDNALTFAAVWCCVRVISETMAVMPWQAFRKLSGGGRERDEAHVVDWLLSKQPNPEMTPFSFKESITAHALTWGNGYAEIERDGAGRPIWLWPVTPDRVCVMRDGSGELVYEIRNFSRDPVYIKAANMLHIPGIGFDGLVGYSVIEMASRSIGLGLDMEEDASSFWANNSTPGGVLEHPGTLGDDAHKLLEESWQKKHGGPKKRGRLAILEEGMKYHGIGLPHNDSQFLENRTFQVSEICRWFRVPPHKVFELGRATWGNIESQETDFVNTTVMPWATRFEQAANMKLFGRQQQGTYYTKFKANSLLRGDSTARAEFYSKMRDLGAYSVNEIREAEDLNPIGKDGDKRLVQVNMTTLEKVGETVQPVAGPVQPTAETKQEPPKPAKDGRKSAQGFNVAPIVADTAQRIVRREMNRVQDARKRSKGDEAAYARFIETFEAEHKEYAAKALAPLYLSFGIADPLQAKATAGSHWTFAKDQYARLAGAIDEPKVTQLLEGLILSAIDAAVQPKETAA